MNTTDRREYGKRERAEIKAIVAKYLTRPSDFGYSGDLDLFNTWSLGPSLEHRDSTLIDQSNSAAIQKLLEDRSDLSGLWEITHTSHWAVGWLDHLSFKVCTRVKVLHTEIIRLTPMVEFWQDIERKLENYCLLDEEDYSSREYESTIENIKQAVRFYGDHDLIDLPEDYANTLYDYFSDNDQSAVESTDDTGGYPSEDQLTAAFESLGWIVEDTED